MMKFRYIITAAGIMLLAFLFSACQKKTAVERIYFLEKIRNTGFLQTYSDEFENLSLGQKLLCYYLSQAAISGDPIIYQQTHPQAVRMKMMLDGILSHSQGMKVRLLQSCQEYAKLFYTNHGFYYRDSGAKIIPSFDSRALQDALIVAISNGAKVGFRAHKDIRIKVEELAPSLFDPQYQPVWSDISMPAMVSDTSALNRAGNDTILPGRFSNELTSLVDNLRIARSYADDEQKDPLESLARYFETADTVYSQNYLEKWFRSNPPVDCLLDFNRGEIGSDPQNSDFFYGLVFVKNEYKQKSYDALKENFSAYIYSLPLLTDSVDFNSEKIKFVAADLITASGVTGFLTPTEVTINYYDIFANLKLTKEIIFSNVLEAKDNFRLTESLLFVSSEEEKTLALKHFLEAESFLSAFGNIFEQLKFFYLPNINSWEAGQRRMAGEIFSQALSIWALGDAKTIELGLLSQNEAIRAGYELWLRDLLMNARYADAQGCFHTPESKATNIILNYCLRDSTAIEVLNINGRTSYTLKSIEYLRNRLKQLLTELYTIINSADVAGFGQLCQNNNLPLDLAGQKEITNRLGKSDSVSAFAIVTPQLDLTTTRMGKITEVVISYPQNVIKQALDITKKSIR